ncbi:MAG: TIGR03790 family protein [Brumimicrobium sp.]|nr:TIGR03790 family protein [Brumimicrobium sp.]
MKTHLLMISFFFSLITYSQSSYDDVAVIINDNSQVSINIGKYFQQARNIPPQNMIHILGPITEHIDSIEFVQIREQIENQLISLGISDSINYLVTTKGVPLKINSGCLLDSVPGTNCASVDSELALILGPLSNSIGGSGAVNNPFFGDTSNFSRDSLGIYLVTRLDGYSEFDVYKLIDRSGPGKGINKISAKAVVDVSNASGSDSTYFVSQIIPAYDYLVNNSWNAEFDANHALLNNQMDVFGYFGLGFGPLPMAPFNYDWTDGSVGALTMSSSAFTFDEGINSGDYLLIADLIKNGCTGALGYVDLIYFSQIWRTDVFLNRYLDTSTTFNLAESYYMAEKTLSWQSVIIGDPKSSVIIDNLASQFENEIEEINLYPNPSAGIVHLRANEVINSVSVFNIAGAQIRNHDQIMSNSVQIDLQDVENGIYTIQVVIGDDVLRKRVVINH